MMQEQAKLVKFLWKSSGMLSEGLVRHEPAGLVRLSLGKASQGGYGLSCPWEEMVLVLQEQAG